MSIIRNVEEFFPGSNHARSFVKYQSGWYGDFTSPTSYSMSTATASTWTWSPPYTEPQAWPDVGNAWGLLTYSASHTDVSATRNLAYDKWIERVQSSSGLAETIATWRESVTLVTGAIRSIRRSTISFVRGVRRAWESAKRSKKRSGLGWWRWSYQQFYNAISTLFEQPSRRDIVEWISRNKHLPKKLLQRISGLWLAYSFGVKPTVESILDSFEAMTDVPPPETVVGKTTRSFGHGARKPYSYLAARVTVKARVSGQVTVANPNSSLASQLGFANPVLLGFQLIPFSFVLDWYTGIERFLSSFTDLLGLDVSQAYSSFKVEGTETKKTWYEVPNETWTAYSATFAIFKRDVGVYKPLPTWPSSAQIGRSLTRLANAAALLGVILTKGDVPRYGD